MNIINNIHSRSLNLYNKFAQSIQERIGAKAMDVMDAAASVIAGLGGGAVASMVLSYNPYLLSAIGLACSALHRKLFSEYFIKPFIEQEINKIVENSKTGSKEKNALMIHTTHDHNGAFTEEHGMIDTYQNCARKFSIDRMRSFSFEEKEKIKSLHKQYDRIMIMAHGNPKQMSTDGDTIFSSLNEFADKKIHFLKFRIKKGGIIVLNACSTAKGDRNIAKILSEMIPDAIIIASSANISAYPGEEYNEDMIPQFHDGCLCKGKDTTCIYQNGSLLNSRVSVPASSSS